MKKIVFGADHRGFNLKEKLMPVFKKEGYEVIDVGCYSQESADYPVVSKLLVEKMQEDLNNCIGVIICGSGIGVSMAVNRYKDIRGALVFNEGMAKSARSHNDANVICFASDYTGVKDAEEFLKIFLKQSFEGGRHQSRVEMFSC
jgi:ribose 5-phosphate isomerase B